MKIVENDSAKNFLKLYVPNNILRMNPVIAGGFIVFLYRNFIKANKKGALKESAGMINSFNDIDIWFLRDNQIWDADHPFNFLVSNLKPDSFKDQTTDGITHAINCKIPALKTYFNASAMLQEDIKNAGLSNIHGIRSSTKWANTFLNIQNHDTNRFFPIQIVKKPQDSIQSLLSSFDIANCCAAYYDGKFYFTETFEDSFQNNLLNAGNSFYKENIQDKILCAKRAFKYARRYDLEFSKDVCEYICEVFFETEEFLKIIKDDFNTEQSKAQEDFYGEVRSNISFLEISESLFFNFKSLILMKNFNLENIFLFLNFKDFSIMHEVKKYIEAQDRLRRGEGESKEIAWDEIYEGLF